MSPNVREMLDKIDTFLTGDIADARALWDVLSALRGPDNGDGESKLDSTLPIRRAAFPKVLAMHEEGSRFLNAAFLGNNELFDLHRAGGEHYTAHARKAAIALGLIHENP